MVDQSAKINAERRRPRSAGVAGGGGHIWIFTLDGDLTIAGTISARGGDADERQRVVWAA